MFNFKSYRPATMHLNIKNNEVKEVFNIFYQTVHYFNRIKYFFIKL